MGKFTRQGILQQLREKKQQKEPIIIGASGVGLIAKTADMAGIDIIMAYCTGPVRLNGNFGLVSYMGYVDCNGISIQMGHKMVDRVQNTPMVAGVGSADPYRDIDLLVDELLDIGFSGITNVPTVGGHDGAMLESLERHGVGYNCEVELIRKCRNRNIFTIAYAFNQEQTRAMVQAGVDIVCPHAGLTADRTINHTRTPSVEEAAEEIAKMKQIAFKENPEVLVACHGGPFVDPDSVEKGLKLSDTGIFVGASTIERIPVEKAIFDLITDFKQITL